LNISGYEIDFKNVVNNILKNDYKKVLLQIPDGLKSHFFKFADFIEEKTNAEVIISADPCFGACDIPSYDLKKLGIELIIHIGHTDIPEFKNSQIQTIFINAVSILDISKVIQKAIPLIEHKKVGLVSTAQHVHLLNEAKELLVNNKFEPFIGSGDARIKLKGQILGCNFSAAKSIIDMIDTFLFIGSGTFHPLGLLLLSNKKVIVCDPYSNEVREKELEDLKDMILRQRYGAIARSKDADVFGILIGTKIGQQRIDLAYDIKKKLDSKQKKSYIFSLNHFFPSFLEGYRDVDCFVSTACPRIAIDDYMQYKVPIITPIELDILLDLKKWEDYQFDEILP
jgi:2-(3-amino-3-carboxypropyl)histidine synthase